MKKIVIAVSILATLVMGACRPETRNQILGIPDDAILLTTENFTDNDAKTSVSGTSVLWVNGDQIDLYVGTGSKQTRDVVVSEGNAYIASALTGDGDIRGYYPAGLATENQTTDNPRVTLPAEYSCSVSGGRQVIALPMVGKADAGATTIKFRHLTAAVNVMLKNSFGSDLYVDSITITSENYQLCSPTGFMIDLTAENLGNNLVSTTIGNRKVKLTLPENLLVAAGSSDMELQVPIRPTGGNPYIITEDHFTIDVYCHGDAKRYHYNYRPDAAVPQLARNMMLTAMVELKLTENGGHMTEIVAPTYRSVNMATATYPFTAQDGDTLYGTKSGYNMLCIIPDGVTVTFRGLSLNSATVRVDGNSSINLEGINSVTAAMNRPAVFVASGNTLTIQGSGSLSATGGSSSAGIGCGPSGNGYAECGNIVIEGGTIDATGGTGAAGIGTGSNANNVCGDITIKNTVTSVTATNGSGATASIGKGNANSTCGTVTIEDGANVTQN